MMYSAGLLHSTINCSPGSAAWLFRGLLKLAEENCLQAPLVDPALGYLIFANALQVSRKCSSVSSPLLRIMQVRLTWF